MDSDTNADCSNGSCPVCNGPIDYDATIDEDWE